MADRGKAAVLAVVALAALGGCAGNAKRAQSQLAELVQWLPGTYDNRAQAREASGAHGHEPLTLVIVPIYAPALGKYAFYAQEMAADDPRRVTAQRVLAFDVVGRDDRIVQATFALAEPVRWRDAHLNPDLFKALIAHQDVRRLEGCDLEWTRQDEGFTAANERASCRITSRLTDNMVSVEMRAELAPGTLALAERYYDAAGRLVHGHREEPFYRFVKRAD